MLTVGDRFPPGSLKAVTAGPVPALGAVDLDHFARGRWLVAFFWPKDFTFVCPTEIAEFGRLTPQFEAAGAAVLGVSTDNEYVHLAWRQQHPELRALPFPMASDLRRDLCEALGIIDRNEGVALRATFVVDPEGVIRFVSVHDLDTGRNAEEVLRTLTALQAGGLTACGWKAGDPTLDAA